MSPRHLLTLAALAAVVRAEAASLDQFVIFCGDAPLRRQVETLAKETRSEVCELIGERTDRGKIPIVISLKPAAGRARPPVVFQRLATPEGAKIEIDAEIGADPAVVNLRRQIVRAVLLEIAYRDRPPVRGGEDYREAPWWLVDGAIEIFRRRDLGVDSELFQRLVTNNKFPSIEQFLTMRADGQIGRAHV